MSAGEVLFVVHKGRERLAMQGEYNWIVSGPEVVLNLPSEREAQAVAQTLTKMWTCRAPDGKAPCPYASYCKFSRQRIQILGKLRGDECDFYRGFVNAPPKPEAA